MRRVDSVNACLCSLGHGGLIGDEMGLGKTLQSIGFLSSDPSGSVVCRHCMMISMRAKHYFLHNGTLNLNWEKNSTSRISIS